MQIRTRVSPLVVGRDIHCGDICVDITPDWERGGAGSNPARDIYFFFHFRDVCRKPFVIYLPLSLSELLILIDRYWQYILSLKQGLR